MSHRIAMDSWNPFAPPLNDWRRDGEPKNINFRELPSCILVPTMHTHCCILVLHGQYSVQFSQITPVQWTNHELYLDVFPKPVPPLTLCSHDLDLPGWKVPSSWRMPTHSWTDTSGEINECKEVSEWLWMLSSVTEVLDFLEYVFVGTRTQRYCSKEFEEGPPWCWAELECEATVKGFGTADLSSLVLSPTVKAISEKCRLQSYCLDSDPACFSS